MRRTAISLVTVPEPPHDMASSGCDDRDLTIRESLDVLTNAHIHSHC